MRLEHLSGKQMRVRRVCRLRRVCRVEFLAGIGGPRVTEVRPENVPVLCPPSQALVLSIWAAVLVGLGLLAMSLDFKVDKVSREGSRATLYWHGQAPVWLCPSCVSR